MRHDELGDHFRTADSLSRLPLPSFCAMTAILTTPSLRLHRAMDAAHSFQDAGNCLAETFLAQYQVCPYPLVNAVFGLKTLFYQTRYHAHPLITKLQAHLVVLKVRLIQQLPQ